MGTPTSTKHRQEGHVPGGLCGGGSTVCRPGISVGVPAVRDPGGGSDVAVAPAYAAPDRAASAANAGPYGDAGADRHARSAFRLRERRRTQPGYV